MDSPWKVLSLPCSISSHYLHTHTHGAEKEDEREMTEPDIGRSTGVACMQLFSCSAVECSAVECVVVLTRQRSKCITKISKQATKRKVMFGYQAQLLYMEGPVRVSRIDYIISVNSIFISTRMTRQAV